jgi:phage gp29-like protein
MSFADARQTLGGELATRDRSIDGSSFGFYLPNPDPVLKALGQDIRVYRDLRSDAHVGGCIRRRKAAVKALEWGVDRDQAQSRVAKNIEAIVKDLPLGQLIGEILDAVLYGYQPLEIGWGKIGSYVVPVQVECKPPEWFCFDAENQLRLRTRDNPTEGEALPERKFLLARQDATYQNPYGFPDLSMCFWPTTFKKGGLKFWVQFTEKYGAPWVIGKHPRGTPDNEADAFLAQLDAMVQDAVAVVPDDSSVEIHEAAGKAASADIYEKLLHFCRSEVSIALLGQNQTTEAKTNFASAKAGIEVTREIRDGDKTIVEDTINTLIRWICDLNFGGVARPTFSLREQEEVDKVLAERDEKLTSAGARLTPQYFKRAYGLQDGDLDETPIAAPLLGKGAPEPRPAAGDDVSFADEATGFPDQRALDDAVASLSAESLDAETGEMLRPLLDALIGARDETEALRALAKAYPTMKAPLLEERLAQLMFAAELAGRVSATQDLDA